MTLARWRPLTFVLVLISGALVAAGVYGLYRGTGTAAIFAAQPKRLTVPAVPELAPPQAGTWQALQQLALFHTTRRYYEAPSPDQLAAPLPDYRLTGVFLLPHKPNVAVLVQPTTGLSRKVVVGDDLDGWVVRTVEIHKVTLEHGAQHVELTDGKGGGASPGIQVRPIDRVAASRGGVRVLGQGGSATSALPANRPIAEPRLYRPPPP